MNRMPRDTPPVTKPKPCPFCGEAHDLLVITKLNLTRVLCQRCKASGPRVPWYAGGRDTAVAFWDRPPRDLKDGVALPWPDPVSPSNPIPDPK